MEEERWRIMAVFPVQEFLDGLRQHLEKEYDFLAISDERELEDIIKIMEPDAVIVDADFKLRDGTLLVSQLRRLLGGRAPIYALVKFMHDEYIKGLYRAGATFCMSCNLDYERILKNLNIYFKQGRPPKVRKRSTFSQVVAQIKLMSSYERNLVTLPSYLFSLGKIDEVMKEVSRKREKQL